jgi:hypothetical protein
LVIFSPILVCCTKKYLATLAPDRGLKLLLWWAGTPADWWQSIWAATWAPCPRCCWSNYVYLGRILKTKRTTIFFVLAEILTSNYHRFVVDGSGVYLPLWTAETSIISFVAHIPLVRCQVCSVIQTYKSEMQRYKCNTFLKATTLYPGGIRSHDQ